MNLNKSGWGPLVAFLILRLLFYFYPFLSLNKKQKTTVRGCIDTLTFGF